METLRPRCGPRKESVSLHKGAIGGINGVCDGTEEGTDAGIVDGKQEGELVGPEDGV